MLILDGTKLYINSCEQQPKGYFIVGRNRATSISSLSPNPSKTDLEDGTKYFDFNAFMKQYSDVTVIENGSYKNEMIYKYYFDVNEASVNSTDIREGVAGRAIQYSPITGKVCRIVFTVNETEGF